VVGAGFKRHIGGTPARGRTRLSERHGFRMRTAAWLRPTAANDGAICANNDAANGGIGSNSSQTARRQTQRVVYVSIVQILNSEIRSRNILFIHVWLLIF
jgi:hypothetical protein